MTAPSLSPTVIWEYVGPTDICQADSGCVDPARWVVQTGTTSPRYPLLNRYAHQLVCTVHRPEVSP